MITNDLNGSLTIGGLQSPCPNTQHFMDHMDRVGKMLHSFDGVFTTEYKKEMFYVDVMARCLLCNNSFDFIKGCRITKVLLSLWSLLDGFGNKAKLPRSTIHIDEDFHYMYDKRGANDNAQKCDEQAWPSRSIFNMRNSLMLLLNDTLSQTIKEDPKYLDCEHEVVEMLKKVLFKDTFTSRKGYLMLRQIGRCNFAMNKAEWDCCKCEYETCHHYDDVLYISASSHEYYRATCSLCSLWIGSLCNRFWRCCIAKMHNQKVVHDGDLGGAYGFTHHCYHFQYEQSYIDFCLKGNVFENSRRHVMCYFDNIDRPEDFTCQ